MSLYFRDNHRLAALHILRETPLGDTLDRAKQSYVVDDGVLLSVDVSEEELDRFSTGEQLLVEALWSLHGTEAQIMLADIAPPPGMPAPLDAECAFAVLWAVGIALGRFEPMVPVLKEAV